MASTVIPSFRVGIGFDAHAFCEGRPCVIGGVVIPDHKGLAGHSDADVLVHAIIDALLGAANLGDIGALFPDTSSDFKDISSIILLERVAQLLVEHVVRVGNIDCVVICETPKIAPHVESMRFAIANALDINIRQITIKGKTTEKLGFMGRKEGVAAQAIALVVV